MSMQEKAIQQFHREAPEVAAAFDGLVQALIHSQGLDEKTKQLIIIALRAGRGEAVAIRHHVPVARQLGATRDEIKDAVLLSLMTSGFKDTINCLGAALDAYDENVPAAPRQPVIPEGMEMPKY